jgi:BASS family bile acid:Na+ symporter
LAVLLFHAGLGLEPAAFTAVARRPRIIVLGWLANLLVPLGFIALLVQCFSLWHNPSEAQSILVGLGVVAAMPIAGSSTAWSQQANGNAALSLALVILSTLLSPVTTPLTLAGIRCFATGEHATALAAMSGQQTCSVLLLCVAVPSGAGMLVRCLVGEERLARSRPVMKLVNALILLFLCYVNASASLPEIVAHPDWDFLLIVVLIAFALCGTAFTAGWWLAYVLRVDGGQRCALMFGLGMNNNGTGMALASASLAALPEAILPVLIYNLVQHVVAGAAKWAVDRFR